MAYVRKTKRPSVEKSMQVITGSAGEPVVKAGDEYRSQLIRAFNYYNLQCDEKDLRRYADAYIKSSRELKQYEYAVSKASFLELKAVGIVGRLVKRGQHIDINDMMKVMEQLEVIKSKYKKPVIAPAKKGQAVVVPMTVQERIAETAKRYVGEIDDHIDGFVMDPGYEFSMKSYLLTNVISGAVAKKISEYYVSTLKEVEQAIAGKDVQLKEGYSNFTKRHLKAFAEFLSSIINDCTQQVVTAKASRKPRARKAKPASVVAAKIKPMKEYTPLKLKSIDPAKIIGATELWVYMPEKRKLMVFRGAHNGELGVKGMSIVNYDVVTSQVKTLRKPEQFFKDLSSTGKRAMNNAWKAIRAKVSKPRARINDEMLLLAAN